MSAAPGPTQNRGGTNVTSGPKGPIAKWTGTGAMTEQYQWLQRGFDLVKGSSFNTLAEVHDKRQGWPSRAVTICGSK